MLDLKHKNLDVWKLSIELVKLIYEITSKFPSTEVYGLSNQLRRASVSFSSNLAEGAARSSKIERKRFYEISRSSLVEIDTQIEIAIALNFIKAENTKEIEVLGDRLFRMTSKLISSTEK